MTVVIGTASSLSGKIGYRNLFDDAVTVTASTEASGFEVANCYDWRLYDWWKPTATGTSYVTAAFTSAVSADYFAVFGHNLHTYGASVKLQYSQDGGVTWADATTWSTPAQALVVFRTFDSILAHRWRVVMYSPTGPASLGVVAFGEALTFQRGLRPGFAPPLIHTEDEIQGVVSDGGVWLGNSVLTRGGKTNIDLQLLTPGWVRDEWIPFLTHAKIKPFFFSWETENHVYEAAFCKISGRVQAPTYSHAMYMSARMPVELLLTI